MFSTILQELKGFFGRDYLLGVFFPIFIFFAADLAVYLEITSSLGDALAKWDAFSLSVQVLLIVSALVAIAVVAYLIYNFQYLIIRLFEGYWYRVPILKWFREGRVRFHKARLNYLRELQGSDLASAMAQEISVEKLAYYPPPGHEEKIMPTRIGNILRASEIHAFDRYWIDSTIIWTRLRPLLPNEFVAAIEEKKVARDFSILLAMLSSVFTLFWCPILAFSSDRWGLFLICASGWPLALISYRNAVESSLAYAEQIKATFDMNRHLLLKALAREVPSNIEEERREWRQLSRFFYRNLPLPPGKTDSETNHWEPVAKALVAWLKSNTD